MFVVDLEPVFSANVDVVAPGGKVQTIRVEFNYLDQDAYKDLFKELKDEPLLVLVGRLVKSWEEKDGAGWVGMPMPFSQEALAAVARKQPRLLRCLLDAYHKDVLGVALGN
jgi:hypothetical protein